MSQQPAPPSQQTFDEIVLATKTSGSTKYNFIPLSYGKENHSLWWTITNVKLGEFNERNGDYAIYIEVVMFFDYAGQWPDPVNEARMCNTYTVSSAELLNICFLWERFIKEYNSDKNIPQDVDEYTLGLKQAPEYYHLDTEPAGRLAVQVCSDLIEEKRCRMKIPGNFKLCFAKVPQPELARGSVTLADNMNSVSCVTYYTRSGEMCAFKFAFKVRMFLVCPRKSLEDAMEHEELL